MGEAKDAVEWIDDATYREEIRLKHATGMVRPLGPTHRTLAFKLARGGQDVPILALFMLRGGTGRWILRGKLRDSEELVTCYVPDDVAMEMFFRMGMHEGAWREKLARNLKRRKQPLCRRGRPQSPAVAARRKMVADLTDDGWEDRQIADALDIKEEVVRADRKRFRPEDAT